MDNLLAVIRTNVLSIATLAEAYAAQVFELRVSEAAGCFCRCQHIHAECLKIRQMVLEAEQSSRELIIQARKRLGESVEVEGLDQSLWRSHGLVTQWMAEHQRLVRRQMNAMN